MSASCSKRSRLMAACDAGCSLSGAGSRICRILFWALLRVRLRCALHSWMEMEERETEYLVEV